MLCGLVGKQGSGKTATMSYLLLQDYAKGLEIFSNYNLTFPRRELGPPKIIDLNLLLDPNNTTLVNASIGLDEFWLFADARQSGTKKNQLISAVLLQSRKRNVDIYATAQSYMQLEKRFRDNADYIIYCKNVRNWIYFSLINRHDTKQVRKYRLDINHIKDLYNTYQIIDPFAMKPVNKKSSKKENVEEETEEETETNIKEIIASIPES